MIAAFRSCLATTAVAACLPAARATEPQVSATVPGTTAAVTSVVTEECPATVVDPCPVVQQVCGPRIIRVVVPPAVVTYKKACAPRVVEASCPAPTCSGHAASCSAAAPVCPPPAPAGRTVLVPYTYYVHVPTYGVAPGGYGAAPVGGYGMAPTYGVAPPAAYGGVPPGYGAAPPFGGVPPGYGAGPAGYGAGPGPAGYGAAPDDLRAAIASLFGKPTPKPAGDDKEECKKQLAELAKQVDKLQEEFAEFDQSSTRTKALLLEIVKQIGVKLEAHAQDIDGLKTGKTVPAGVAEWRTGVDREVAALKASLEGLDGKTVGVKLKEVRDKIDTDIKKLKDSLKPSSFNK